MTEMFNRVEELVHRSHCDHVTDLAASALIERDGRFLLVDGRVKAHRVPGSRPSC